MLECACYGIIKQNFISSAKFEIRHEHIFIKDTRSLHIRFINGDINHNQLFFRDPPDRNKQKNCVITQFHKSTVLNDSDPILFATSLGYIHFSTIIVNVWISEKNGYQIELSLSKKTGWYLVKIFVETDDLVYGEALIEKASRDFEDIIILSKPDLFYTNNF